MPIADLGDVQLNYAIDGPEAGLPVVFAHALGADHRIWDQVVAQLSPNLRLIRYDCRGHGASSTPAAPYSMGMLIRDAERLLDHLAVRDCVFVGLSMGGMIAQGLAIKRLDQVRALVLANTAAKIATAQIWHEHVTLLSEHGVDGMADTILPTWFARKFQDRDTIATWRARLIATPLDGFIGCAAAIGGTDFYTTTASLTLPTLGIASADDTATPSDLVRETVALIKGSRLEILRGAGHLAPVEVPQAFAALLSRYFLEIGHI
jgi:3-oxoadipate enol-lactonase